jgi:alanyl-tRNA synthetase
VQPGQHGWRVLAHTVEEADMELLSQLAGDLVQASCVAVLLHGTAAGRDTYVFARSPQGSVDMAALLREVGLRGGGRPDFARGSVAQGDGKAILHAARDLAQQRMEEGESAR